MHTETKFGAALMLIMALSTSLMAANEGNSNPPEADSELCLAQWGGIIIDESANAILAAAARSFPADKDIVTFKMNLADLREICRRAEDSDALDVGRIEWMTWQINRPLSWRYSQSKHNERSFYWTFNDIGFRKGIGWRYDYVSIAERDLQVTARTETGKWEATANFFETLMPNEAAVLIFRPKDFSRGYSFIKVWHAEVIPAAMQSEIANTQFSTWLRYGMEGLVQSRNTARAWGAAAPASAISEKWTTKLPFGSLQLNAISRPQLAPFARWTPDGAPALPEVWSGMRDLGILMTYTSSFDVAANQERAGYLEIKDTENTENTEVYAAIGDGPWEELGKIGKGKTSLEVEDTLFVAEVRSSGSESGGYFTVNGVVPTYAILRWPATFDREIQLAAVERPGKEHLVPGQGLILSVQPIGSGTMISHEFPFEFANFDHLVIRARPYQKAVFSGFQMEPPVLPSADTVAASPYHRRKQVPQHCFVEIELPLNDEPEGSNGQASVVYQAMRNGMCTSVLDIRGEETRDNKIVLLSDEQVRMAEKLVKDLRDSTSDLPPSQTVIVRRFEGSKFSGAVYNREKLPKSLNALFEIIGRRKELEGRGNDAELP